MAKAKEQTKKAAQKGRDSATGLRTGTKKFSVYQVWKSGKPEEEGVKAALKFLGTHDAAAENSTKASVIAWFREFDRKFR